MHERIDLARGVIAGEHRLTIQLLRDINSCAERGIVFIWPPASTVIQPAQLAAISNAIVAALAAARIQLQRSQLANCEQHSQHARRRVCSASTS